jgi:type IV pilus assembly protein PilE
MHVDREGGFTLTELMITVTIVSVLAALAYPSYTRHLVRSNRAAAQAQMLDIANREQQFLLANRAYAPYAGSGGLTASGYSLPASLASRYLPTITVGESTVPAFTITFGAIGMQADDGDLSLNSEGLKSPAEKW